MKNFLHEISPSHITFKLSLLVSLLVVVSFSALEIYNFNKIKSEVTQETHEDQYTQAKFIAKDIKNKLDKRIRFLGVLADIIPPDSINSKTQLLSILKSHQPLTDFFPQGFAIIPSNGEKLIAEYPILPGRSKLTFNQSEWFIRALKSESTVVSIPFLSRTKGEVLIVIAKAIRDKKGKVVAVLEAPIFLNRPGLMDYIFDKYHRPQGDILVISRAHEIFVASSKPKLLLKSTPANGINRFHDGVMQGFNGFDHTVNAFGEEMLTAAADIEIPNWFVIVRTPVKDVYQHLNQRLKNSLMSGILVSFMAVMAISIALFIFFTPLRQAAKSVREMVINKQQLTHIKIVNHDEVSDLIIGFNALIDMVNERNSHLETANAELESLSQTDGLTDIANRRSFDHTIRHTWRVHQRKQQPLTLLLIDIDHFKKFNDKYGHIAGDDCLKIVANTLQKTVKRPTDFTARYGGEEFVILLQGTIEEGINIAQKIRIAISDLNIAHSESEYQHVTISIGVASITPNPKNQYVDLIEQADQALYQSKDKGRNRYQCYHNESNLNYVDYGEFI